MTQQISHASDRLNAAERTALQLSAEKTAIEHRIAEIYETAGAAKWRQEQKETVDQILIEAQNRFHAKIVGSYERLLTHIVKDILPGELNIKLNLATARGKPSLDIMAERPSGTINVQRGSGGSLRNILSTGLRAAAIIKSKQRKFMALDEAECWIKPDHIPAYGAVLTKLARELGLQTILVTHHDPKLFPDAHIIRLDGSPETGITAIASQNSTQQKNSNDTNYIESIRLADFMSHSDTFVQLAPDISFLTGDNNAGKSAILAALRAVTNSDFRDEDIRHGAERTIVEVAFHDGSLIRVIKSIKKHIKTHWSLIAPDGTELSSDGTEQPEFIKSLLKMPRHGELELHIAEQDPPTFLLSQTPAQRAEILSIGEEASHLDQLMENWKKLQRDDASLIRSGEIELTRLMARQATLAQLSEIAKQIADEKSSLAEIHHSADLLESLGAKVRSLEEMHSGAALAQSRIDKIVLEPIPALNDPSSILPAAEAIQAAYEAYNQATDKHLRLSAVPDHIDVGEMTDTAAIARFMNDLAWYAQEKARLEIKQGKFSNLPDPVILNETKPVADHLKLIEAGKRLLKNNEIVQNEIMQEEIAFYKVLAAWEEETHGLCPTCGTPGFDPLADHQH